MSHQITAAIFGGNLFPMHEVRPSLEAQPCEQNAKAGLRLLSNQAVSIVARRIELLDGRPVCACKIRMQMHRLAVGKRFDLLNENAIQFHKMERLPMSDTVARILLVEINMGHLRVL